MGWEDRLPSPSELRHMQDLANQGMKDGAFGFSTGLTYSPGIYSSTHELVEICRAIRPYGGIYVTHSRYSLGDTLLDPFREAIDIGREASVPVQISHYNNPVDGMGQRMVNLVDEGRNSGVDVTFDQYPYPASSTLLLSLVPAWVHAGGPSHLMDRMKSRDVREQIKDHIYPRWGGGFEEHIFSHIGSHKNKEWQGRSLEDMARAQRKDMVDTICDLLLEENLDVAFVARTGNLDNISTILKHPAQMVGSDGLLTGDRPNPRTYGTFPYILGQVVREEELLTIEEAVSKMTGVPAQRLGFKDRGLLRTGMKADIVVFDPKRVRATSTFEDPKQLPEGIEYVLVNGGLVIDQGEHTGLLPGRALKHS
jgi:N-acyl-D-amino-acid deacylase